MRYSDNRRHAWRHDDPPKSGIDRSAFDLSVNPGDDFFQHVNGHWIKRNPIPPQYSRWGAFYKLRDDNLSALHKILDELAKQTSAPTGERRKLRDFYRMAMDEPAIQRLGASSLKPSLQRIDKIDSSNDLVVEIGRLRATGIDALFNLSVEQDEKQSDRYAARLDQGGLGLPDRDYYIGKSADSERVRDLYRQHVAKMLGLLGDAPETASAGADAVMRIETRLAEASRTPVQLRDREAQYNKLSLAELKKLAPRMDWNLYLATLDVNRLRDVIVGQPEFFERVNELFHSIPLEEWRTYLRWHLVHSMAAYLSTPFEDEDFRFYSQELRGVKEMQPRWKRVVTATDGHMGEALGKIYVEKHFPPAAKKRMDELVKNLMEAYRERIESRDWMGPKTKKLALPS